MDISIGDNHKATIAFMQHAVQLYDEEARRLQIETAYVLRQGRQAQTQLIAFLQQSYGVDAAHVTVTVDLERGVITVPDEAPTEAAETAGE